MVFLKILLGIVLFCLLIGAVPLRVRIRLEEEFTVLAGIGPLLFIRIPKKPKPVRLGDFTYRKHQKRLQRDQAARLKKKQKKQESDTRKAQKKQQKADAKAKELEETVEKANRKENKLDAILEIVGCVLDGLPNLFGGFRCRIYRLDVTAGGKEAADTAQNFAVFSQALSLLLEFLDCKTCLIPPKPETIAVRADFLLDKPHVEADFYLQIRIGQILGPLFGIGFNCVKALIRNH